MSAFRATDMVDRGQSQTALKLQLSVISILKVHSPLFLLLSLQTLAKGQLSSWCCTNVYPFISYDESRKDSMDLLFQRLLGRQR